MKTLSPLLGSHFKKRYPSLKASAPKAVSFCQPKYCIYHFDGTHTLLDFLNLATLGKPLLERSVMSLSHMPIFWYSQRNGDCLLCRPVIDFTDTAPYVMYVYNEDVPIDLKGPIIKYKI